MIISPFLSNVAYVTEQR